MTSWSALLYILALCPLVNVVELGSLQSTHFCRMTTVECLSWLACVFTVHITGTNWTTLRTFCDVYRSKTNLICYRAFLLWVYYVFSYRALIAELSFFGRTVSGCLRNRFRLRSHRLDDVWKWIMISRLVNPIVATEIARLTIATVYWKWHSLISEVFDCVCSLQYWQNMKDFWELVSD